MRNLRVSCWGGRRSLGTSPVNVGGRWSCRSSEMESDGNRWKVREPGPSLDLGPSLPRGRWRFAKKRAALCEKRARGFGFSWSRGFRTMPGGTRLVGARFAAASPRFVLK